MGALVLPSRLWAGSAPTLGLPLRLPGGTVPANPFPIETPHWPTSPFPAQVAPAVLSVLPARPPAAVPVSAPVARVAVLGRVELPRTAQALAEARRPEAVIEALRETLGMKPQGRPEPVRLNAAFDGSEVPAPKAPAALGDPILPQGQAGQGNTPAVDARPARGPQPKQERPADAKPQQPKKPAQPSRPFTLPEDDLMRELGLGDDWR